MSKPEDSAPIQLLSLVYWGPISGSWIRLNACLQNAMRLAIKSQLKFLPGDLDEISNRFKWGHWCSDGEGFYATACGGDREPPNISYCREFERYEGRPSYILGGRRLHAHNGSRFTWNGERLIVTSLTPEHMIACSYNADGRVKGRHKITRRQLKAAEKAGTAAR